jgi:hypothetical protein
VSDLLPLVVLWALSQRSGPRDPFASPFANTPQKPPLWPDIHSPPPPLPAFEPHVPAPQPQPQHGTPLDALHKGTQKIVKTARVLDKARAAAKKAAPTAARQLATQALDRVRKGVTMRDPFSGLLPSSRGDALVSKPVADVQAIVNARGGRLARDGLWGPKTAAAWSALARSQGLPATIERGGPKVARVAMHTWDVLSVPMIP